MVAYTVFSFSMVQRTPTACRVYSITQLGLSRPSNPHGLTLGLTVWDANSCSHSSPLILMVSQKALKLQNITGGYEEISKKSVLITAKTYLQGRIDDIRTYAP